MRGFKGMNGAPKSLYDVWRGRTWDRLTGTRHVPYGDTGPVVVVGVTPHQGDGKAVHSRAKGAR
jgi:hypothetical protein